MDSGALENVICSCLHCKTEVGCFKNSWNGLGKSYISPIYHAASCAKGLEATDNKFLAAAGTMIELRQVTSNNRLD